MRRTHQVALGSSGGFQQVAYSKWPKSSPHAVYRKDGRGTVGSVSSFGRGRWFGVVFGEIDDIWKTRTLPGWFKSRKTAVAAVLRAAEFPMVIR